MNYKKQISILFVTLCALCVNAAQPQWDSNLNFEEIENRLRTEPVAHTSSIRSFLKKIGKTPSGTHSVTLVELESGLKGVFKKEKACYGELAAYNTAKALGLRLVPPTVLREINGIQGSLQFYVDSSIDLIQNSKQIFSKLSFKAKSDMALFYFFIGQWDNHPGNQIVSHHDGKYYLALIDNGGILRRQYVQFGDSSFIQKGCLAQEVTHDEEATFPYEKVRTIKRNDAYKQLEGYVTHEYLNSLSPMISYVIWKNCCYIKRYQPIPAIKKFASSTLEALKLVDRAQLEAVWAELKPVDPERYEDLIELMLDRKNQILNA